jgi:hypothetical protein
MNKSLLIRLLIATTSLLSASIYLWSAIAYKHAEFYKHISSLSVCMIIFHFNVFMINIKIKNSPRISKFINICFIFCVTGFVVFSNIYNYFIDASHPIETSIITYLMFGVLECVYGIVLIALISVNYTSRLMDNENQLIRLFCLQFAYIITTLSQVIPLYMQKKIPLTNDFVYLFWLLFILDENTNFRRKVRDYYDRYNSSNDIMFKEIDVHEVEKTSRYVAEKMFAVIFVIATVIGVYLFSVINYNDDNGKALLILRDIMSFISCTSFYVWTLLSFHKISTDIIDEPEYMYNSI